MPNELDLYSNGGQIVPVSPGGDLVPISPADDWGETPDYLSERPTSQPLPNQQVEQNFQQLATVFTNDFASLGYVQKDIDKCIAWFRNSLVNPPRSMPAKKHSYNLWQYSHDPVMNSFANYAATQKFPQSLLQSICYWVQQLENLQHGQQQSATSGDPTDALSDADYERVQQINTQAAANTEGYLRDLWGSSYAGNMQVVQQEWAKLSTAEQEHLSSYTTGWIKGTNSPEVLLGLFRQAIGAGSLPQSGAAISQEIASIENVMRTERSKYMANNQMQARLRTLYQMRGD